MWFKVLTISLILCLLRHLKREWCHGILVLGITSDITTKYKGLQQYKTLLLHQLVSSTFIGFCVE